ncbi:zf-HC2 domain-containing protein [Paenibacillus sp. PL2-23]|uniref:zf-HC2 domain-containing protein n=1 Tax=Paenibacillus sp. PL2-23 TaxID=2100729 RepID=UPI0030FD1B47
MNCQEVMELMQRQLDDDLDDEEMIVLNNHTRQCPDCAAAFERLQRLSAELASLPKVTPSFSLVDAIMPELERIDLAAREATMLAGAAGTAPEPMKVDGASVSRRVKPARRWPSWSAVGSVVAAGVVAGVFLLNAPNFDGGSGAYDSAQYSADMNTAGEASAGASDITKLKKNEGGDLSEGDIELYRSGAPSQGEEANDAPSSPEAGGAAPSGAAVKTAPSIARETRDESPSAPAPEAAVEPSMPPDNEVKEERGLENGSGGPLSDDAVNESEPLAEESERMDSVDQKGMEMGIASAISYPSPDGAYVARVEDYSIVITAAATGELLMETARKNGHHGGLVWSEDGSELLYEVQLDYGATVAYTISTDQWTEKKASH